MFGSDDMYARLLELVPGERPFPSIKWAGWANFNAALVDLPGACREARAASCAASTA